ncbi:hypothetical protein F5Y02DRAFT_430623 [Annulohypoxylon stygium]|nr:hypothetical protein F5Y02DRAFT_430623 [Annulohypoxylon stygium]
MSTLSVFSTPAIPLPTLRSYRPEIPLGRLVELIYDGEPYPESTDPAIRALMNWYRLQFVFSSGDADFFITWDQRYTYHLLFDWWTAAFDDPKAPRAYAEILIAQSPILKKQVEEKYFVGKHRDLWECIGQHFGLLPRLPPDFSLNEKDLSEYDKALWELFLTEFFRGDVYDDYNIDFIKSARQQAAFTAYHRQAGMRHDTSLRPPIILQHRTIENSFACSIEASDPRHPRHINRGPLLRACPWLDRKDENSTQLSNKPDPLSGWPRYLWHLTDKKVVDMYETPERPRYTTISHTWGRWADKDKEGCLVPGGLKYRVPYNEMFEVDEIPGYLEALIGKIETEYVWLDLVYIPQGVRDQGDNNHNSTNVLSPDDLKIQTGEIARQGSIFRNATASIAWWHDCADLSCLKELYNWLSLLSLAPSQEIERKKSIIAEKIQNQNLSTGLLRKNDETAANSWFTSLWTLQELCLRPDMWLAVCKVPDKDSPPGSKPEWNILTAHDDNTSQIPLNGFVSLYKSILDVSGKIKVEENKVKGALTEVYNWLTLTGLSQLMALSQVDSLRLRDSRYCEERRAEAIMSAIGATKWFEEVRVASYDPEKDEILGIYPRKFIEEVRKDIPGKFFATYLKVPDLKPSSSGEDQTGRTDMYGLGRTDKEVDEGAVLASHYQSSDQARGSLLPFSQSGYILCIHFPMGPGKNNSVGYTHHSSVDSWTIEHNGNVDIKEACILSSSLPSRCPTSTRGMDEIFLAFSFAWKEKPEDEFTVQRNGSAIAGYDLHEWARSRNFEVYLVVVMSHKSSHKDGNETWMIEGVVLRGDDKKGNELDVEGHRKLVKIENFFRNATTSRPRLPVAGSTSC